MTYTKRIPPVDIISFLQQPVSVPTPDIPLLTSMIQCQTLGLKRTTQHMI